MHIQNRSINRCTPSLETATAQVITYHHFAFAQKIRRVTNSATLPYIHYTSEVFIVDTLHPIYDKVHRNAISDFHSSVESGTFASSEV